MSENLKSLQKGGHVQGHNPNPKPQTPPPLDPGESVYKFWHRFPA